MIRCECCSRDIEQPVIITIAGPFLPSWGLCRQCWRLVGKLMRCAIVTARIEFRAAPHLAQSVALYWLWEIGVAEARFRAGQRVAA